MPRAILVVTSYDPYYLRVAEHLVRVLQHDGCDVVVLDSEKAIAGPVGSYHHGLLRLTGTAYPGHDLSQRLTALGAEVVGIAELSSEEEPPLSPEAEAELETAVMSALITFFRTETPRESRRAVRRARRRLVREGRRVYRAILELLDRHPDADRVVVPNGRTPSQKMASLAARHRSLPTFHYEKGETPDGAYFQPYSPQSRLESQAAVTHVLGSRSRDEIDAVADEWLRHRAPAADSRNEFSALWTDGLPEEFTARAREGRVAGFFTSSQDEYQSLGEEWQTHSWESQFEAFEAMLLRFTANGYSCYLRVHPNLATKADDSFRRERDGVRDLARRHPHLLVIWHDDFVDSYALLSRTDAVVVWDSTIGLEASARGLPVWSMATSRYGLTADVRELLSRDAVTDDSVTAWKVDAHAAKRFIAYLVLRDTRMPPLVEPWEPWKPGRPPRALPVARVLVSGGNPTVGAAIRSLVDVYRHRRFRSNLRSLRRNYLSR